MVEGRLGVAFPRACDLGTVIAWEADEDVAGWDEEIHDADGEGGEYALDLEAQSELEER